MAVFKITTTGVQNPVVFNDLGKRTFEHPTVDYNLTQEYTIEEINASNDIKVAIDNGWIMASDEYGNSITSSNDLYMNKPTYDNDNDGVVDSAGSVDWANINGAPTTFPPSVHTHVATDVTDFDAEVSNNRDVSDNTTHRSLTNNPHSTTHLNLSGDKNAEIDIKHVTDNEKLGLDNAPNSITSTNPVSDKLYTDSIHDIIIPMINAANSPYLSTTSPTYVSIARFVFRGTNVYIPIHIKFTGWVGFRTMGALRIYDKTFGLVIAENARIINMTEAIIDLGKISNLPTTESIWEVQIRRVSGSNYIYISSIIIEFI